MRRTTRRTTLGVLGSIAATGLVGGATARRGGWVARLLSTGEPVPENVAVAENGDLYVGISGGSVRRLPADRTAATGLTLDATDPVARYPGGVAGVTVADDTLYTTVNGDRGSVFAVDLGDANPTALATPLPDGDGLVNDLLVDDDRLLVTESFGGTVYEIGRGDGAATVWLSDDRLDTETFGANGIARIDDDVYVAVTRAGDVGRIVRVPVDADGGAGDPETVVESGALFGADGLTARGPQLYVAVNARDRIVRVTPSGELATVAEGDPLSFPSEVVFDPTRRGRGFVCNFSPRAPDAAGVVRVRP